MAPARPVRTGWIVAGLLLGFAVVATGPVLLFWDFLHPSPWNDANLRAEFQSVRYESGGLVFRYAVHNLTGHSALFRPSLTEVRALQSKDRPPVGYPNVMLPFNVPPGGSHVVEVRLEIASLMRPSSGLSSGDPNRRALQNQPLLPDAAPPSGAAAPAHPPAISGPVDFALQDALSDLEGFELVDETEGIRLVLPRAW